MAVILKELASITCPACGGAKRPGRSLCKTDYFRLPKPMQSALWKKINQGYAAARNDALKWLKENGTKPEPERTRKDLE